MLGKVYSIFPNILYINLSLKYNILNLFFMKLKTLKNACYGFVLLAITSCTDEEQIEVASEVTFSATIETPVAYSGISAIEVGKSRTFIDENEAYESGVGTLWRTNETIGVYGSSTKKCQVYQHKQERCRYSIIQWFHVGNS